MDEAEWQAELRRARERGRSAASLFDFGALARTYDAWYATSAGLEHDRIQKRAMQDLLAHASGRTRLLDVGCGTGHWSRFFASLGYVVSGVDISPAMIASARAGVSPGCTFLVGDAHRLPFADGTFAVAAAMAALEFMTGAADVLREMARLTRAGGALLVGVLNRAALLNRERIARGEEPYASGRLFAPDELCALLEPYGSVRLQAPYQEGPPCARGGWDDPFILAWVQR